MPPRRALSPAELDAVCAAYALGEVVGAELVYEGTSSLYRTVCRSARESRTVAVKIQDAGPSVAAAKSFEAFLLTAIRPAFPGVPVLLRPGTARIPQGVREWGALEWGLVGRRFAVSVYEWVEARSWQATPEQRRATVAGLGVLQARLDAVGAAPDVVRKAEHRSSLLDADVPGFVREFEASERRRRTADPAAGLDQQHLDYLDDRCDVLRRTFLDDWRGLVRTSTGLAHADFTPGNCGYAGNGELAIVFDIESVRRGVRPLFGAIAVGAFSIDRGRAVDGVVAALQEIVDGLRRSSPSLSPPPGFTLPLLRLAYLDAVRRQLHARKQNPVRRWGFLKEDVENLRWLDHHESSIAGI